MYGFLKRLGLVLAWLVGAPVWLLLIPVVGVITLLGWLFTGRGEDWLEFLGLYMTLPFDWED